MIEITPEQQQRIGAQVAAGTFKEPGHVLQAALDMLEHRQGEYEQLATAIQQADRGECQELNIEDIKRRGRDRLTD